MMKHEISVYDTKPYDQESFSSHQKSGDFEWRFHPFRLTETTAHSASGCQSVCAFVNDSLDRAVLKALAGTGVRHIAMRCAGFNNVDLEAARDLELTVTRVPAYSPHAVAEHTVALLLTLNRKIHRAYNRVREQNFSLSGLVGFDLYGKSAGIIGTGKIGRLTGEILRGFGMEVFAFDPYPDVSWSEEKGIQYVSREELFSRSDVLSLHVPLNPDTHHLINFDRVRHMKPGVFLLNTSRGGLIDTTALIDGLKSGRIGGVGLDVYEEEEGVFFEDLSGEVLQDDELARLLTFPNVLITSHQAFLTREALQEIARVTVENIQRIQNGNGPLPDTVLT